MCYLSYCKFVCSILWIILIEKKRWWLDIGPCNWKWLLSKADFQTSEIKYTLKWNLLHIKLLHIFQQIIHMISCSFLLKVDISLCNLSLVSGSSLQRISFSRYVKLSSFDGHVKQFFCFDKTFQQFIT